MWPFDEEPTPEPTQADPVFAEFQDAASTIFEQAPDVDTGLSALKDVYSSYEFQDSEAAKSSFIEASDNVRKRFGDTKPFDEQSTLSFAPIDMMDIVPKAGENPQISILNQWEENNIKTLNESNEPEYLQAKSQLTRGIQDLATQKRREIYGKENYIGDDYIPKAVTDTAFRIAEGAISPIADLVGADGVSDWLHNNTDAERDDDYWSAIASGIGSAAGAVGAGVVAAVAAPTVAVAGAIGAGGYLLAQGVDSVVDRYQEAKRGEATDEEAFIAAGLEGVSQAAQAAVGGKIFGEIAGKVAGKVAPKLGTKIIPKILGSAALEAGSEGGGQVISNIAENIGAGDEFDKDLGRGVPQSIVAGAVVAGSFEAGAEVSARRNAKANELVSTEINPTQPPPPADPNSPTNPAEVQPPPQNQDTGDDLVALKEAVQSVDGTPPPVREVIPKSRSSIDPPDTAKPVYEMSDGTKIIENDGQVLFQTAEKTLEPFESLFHVDPAVHESLKDLTQSHAPDGTAITVKEKGGKLFVESEFVRPDLTISPDKTGKTEVEVKTSATPTDSVVLASKTRTTDGIRQNPFFIPPGKVKTQSAGAAQLQQVGKEHQYAAKLREKFGDEKAERYGMSVEVQTSTPNKEGGFDIVEKQIPMWTYMPLPNAEGGDIAYKVIADKGSYSEALASIQALKAEGRYKDEDNNVLTILDKNTELAIVKAWEAGDDNAVAQLEKFHAEILETKAPVVGTFGRGLQTQTEAAQGIVGGVKIAEVPIIKIKNNIRVETNAAIEAEFGKGVTRQSIKQEVLAAEAAVKELDKAVPDSTEKELGDIDAEIEVLSKAEEEELFDKPIQQYTKDIAVLERNLEAELEKTGNQMGATETNIKEQITQAEKDLREVTLEDDNKAFNKPIQQYTEEVTQLESELAKESSSVTDELGNSKETITKEIVETQQEIERITEENRKKKFDEPIAQYNKEIQQLEKELTKESKGASERVTVAGKELTDTIDATEVQIDDLEQAIKTTTAKKGKPTSEQTKKLASLRGRLQKLHTEFDVNKTRTAKKSHVVQKTRTLIAERKLAIRHLEKQSKQAQPLTPKQKQLTEVKLPKLNKLLSDVAKRSPKEVKSIKRLRSLMAERKQAIRKLEKARKAPRVPTPRQKAYQQKIDNLKVKFQETATRTPKEAVSVKKIRGLIDERSKAIRKLSEAKTNPREPSAKIKKLQDKKAKIVTEKAGTRATVDPELQKQRTAAKAAETRAKAKAARVEQIFNEKMSKFTPEEEKKLRGLYEARKTALPGTQIHRVDAAIFAIESKGVTNAAGLNRVHSFWVRNKLSGILTHLKNIKGNTTKAISIPVSQAVSSIVNRDTRIFSVLEGQVRGYGKSFRDVGGILAGSQSAKTKFDAEFDAQYSIVKPLINTNDGFIKGIHSLLDAPGQMLGRLLAAEDAFFNTGGAEGQAYLAAHVIAEAQNIPMGKRREFVQNLMFNTDKQLKAIREEVEGQAAILKDAGITLSKNEIEKSIYERMQSSRDSRIQELSERGGKVAAFQQHPDGVAGLLYDSIDLSKRDRRGQLRFRDKVIKPMQWALPFVKVSLNISNELTQHTPVGVASAARVQQRSTEDLNIKVETEAKNRVKEAAAQGVPITEEDAVKQLKGEQKFKEDQALAGIEARQIMGQSLTGSLLMGGLLSMALIDDKDGKPLLEFYANYPPGKMRDWQENNIPEYSVRYGKTIIPLKDTVLALIPAMLAPAVKGIKGGAEALTVVGNMAMAGFGAYAKQSMLKPLGDMFDALNGVQGSTDDVNKPVSESKGLSAWNGFENQVTSYLGGFIYSEGLLKNMTKWMEASPTETYNNLTAKLFGNLPGARALGVGKPQLNRWGEPMEVSFASRISGESGLLAAPTDPRFLWMAETGYKVTDQGPIISLGKEDQKRFGEIREAADTYKDILSEEESYLVKQIAGPQEKAFIDSVRTDPYYQVYNQKNQDYINKQISKIRANAKYEVLSGG